MACRLDPVISISKIYIIEIKLHNIIFTIFLLKLHCNKDFLYFTLPCFSGIKVYIPRKLHRYRASTLTYLSILDYSFGRPDYGFIVYTIMTVKLFILNTNHSRNKVCRYILIFNIFCVFFRCCLRYKRTIRIVEQAGPGRYKGIFI